jgi:predicted DNA-binding transcriptional regulator AlpA
MPTERRRYISDTTTIGLLGISRRTFYRLLADGTITPPVERLAKNRRGWTVADIELARTQMAEKKESK